MQSNQNMWNMQKSIKNARRRAEVSGLRIAGRAEIEKYKKYKKV